MMRRPQHQFSLLTGGLGVLGLPAPPAQVALPLAVYRTLCPEASYVSAPPVRVPMVPNEEAQIQHCSLRNYTRIGGPHTSYPATQPPFGGVVAPATLHAFPAAPRSAAPKPQDPPAIQRSHGCTLW